MDVDEGVRGHRGVDGGDGHRQQGDPGRLVGAGTSPLLVWTLTTPSRPLRICNDIFLRCQLFVGYLLANIEILLLLIQPSYGLANRICTRRKTDLLAGLRSVLNLALQRLLILNDRLAEKTSKVQVCSRGNAAGHAWISDLQFSSAGVC